MEEETDPSTSSSSLPDTQLVGLLSHLLQKVESLTNQEEVELRAKIEALGLVVTKTPIKSTQNLDEQPLFRQLQKQQTTAAQDVATPSTKKKTSHKKKSKDIQEEDENEAEELKKVVRIKWPATDEIKMARAWFEYSKNAIDPNDPKNGVLWANVEKQYNTSNPTVPRTTHHLRSHWHLIKPKVGRFNELYLAAKSRYKSDWSEDQFMEQARNEFMNDPQNKNGNPFTYEHIWKIVKDHPKYKSSTHVHDTQSGKRSKINNTGEYTATSTSDTNFSETPEFGSNLGDDHEIQEEQVPLSKTQTNHPEFHDPVAFGSFYNPQPIRQMQGQQTTAAQDVVTPSTKKKTSHKKKSKGIQEEDEKEVEVTKAVRIKWPASDEIKMARAWSEYSKNTLDPNDPNNGVLWANVEKQYNTSNPTVPRTTHHLRSHWHLVKPKVGRFNELYLAVKSRDKSDWSEDQFMEQARNEFMNDPQNKNGNPFTYEHIWKVVKDHPKYNSSTDVHGTQSSKRSKTNNTGGYTASSTSDANFGDTPELGINLGDDHEIQEEQVPLAPTIPMGRDKAKAITRQKGKGTSPSSTYEEQKLRLIKDIAETNRLKKDSIREFDNRMAAIVDIERNKLMVKEKKLLYIDTSHMSEKKRANHEIMCKEIMKKYNMDMDE